MKRASSLDAAFKYAVEGIRHAFVTQRNFKIECAFALAAIILGFAFAIDFTQWAIIWVCIGVVLAGECLNTAIESVVDLVSPRYNELAKRAKDCAAAGVLLAAIASLAVAANLFIPRFTSLFS